MSLKLRSGANERVLAERPRTFSSNQVKDRPGRFATYFVIGLAIIVVGTAVASFMPLP